MTQAVSSLAVAVTDQTAFVKVTGRADFNKSISLKTLVKELNDRGYAEFVLDLTDCTTMDSTFLGGLAGIVLSFPQRQQASSKVSLHLLNPSPRISDLLDGLGISHLFPVRKEANPVENDFQSPSPQAVAPSKEEISTACLEAHQNLMAVNPENIPRFKDVVQFLAEDLKKLKA